MRCTVCTWRGSFEEAQAAQPVRRSDIPPGLGDIQEAYEHVQFAKAMAGARREPPCPSCGHHIVKVRRASIRPAM